MNRRAGFFLIARGSLHHVRFKPRGAYSSFEAWIWLIESAAYAECEVAVMIGTQRRLVHLLPGQLTYSIRYLASAWAWSPNRVQRFLDDLRDDGSVNTQTDTAQTLITLCNWDKYQKPFEPVNTQADTQSDTQTNTNKKEIKEKKEYARSENGFAEWYIAYGKKVNPKAAAKAYARVIAAGDISESQLLERTKTFAAGWAAKSRDQRQFMPYPASWLNAGGYASEPDGDGGETVPVQVPRDPRTFTESEWQKRVDHVRQGNDWLTERWGPAPGKPGCLVPANLVISTISASKGAA